MNDYIKNLLIDRHLGPVFMEVVDVNFYFKKRVMAFCEWPTFTCFEIESPPNGSLYLITGFSFKPFRLLEVLASFEFQFVVGAKTFLGGTNKIMAADIGRRYLLREPIVIDSQQSSYVTLRTQSFTLNFDHEIELHVMGSRIRNVC